MFRVAKVDPCFLRCLARGGLQVKAGISYTVEGKVNVDGWRCRQSVCGEIPEHSFCNATSSANYSGVDGELGELNRIEVSAMLVNCGKISQPLPVKAGPRNRGAVEPWFGGLQVHVFLPSECMRMPAHKTKVARERRGKERVSSFLALFPRWMSMPDITGGLSTYTRGDPLSRGLLCNMSATRPAGHP